MWNTFLHEAQRCRVVAIHPYTITEFEVCVSKERLIAQGFGQPQRFLLGQRPVSVFPLLAHRLSEINERPPQFSGNVVTTQDGYTFLQQRFRPLLLTNCATKFPVSVE